jgi:hypothetical protein
MKLYGIYLLYTLVIIARKGYVKVIKLILALETTHKVRDTLTKAANKGHVDVILVMLENFLGHCLLGFHDTLSKAIARGHLEVKRVI